MNNLSIDTSFLIEPDALRTLGETPMIIDTRMPERHAEGHLPGAINLCTYDRIIRSTSPIGLGRFQREIAGSYSQAGVTVMRPIVLYEEQTGMRAARECWMLQYLGHPDVRILHGGLQAWVRMGGQLTTGIPDVTPDPFPVQPQSEIVISVNGILAQAGRPNMTLLDVRSSEEFTGTGGSSCCKRQGRIPGSIRVGWTAFMDETTGRFKSSEAIHRLLTEYDIETNREIVAYCHRGARSAAVYYALRYAGYPRVRNFIGSWHEWAARYDLPIESGE